MFGDSKAGAVFKRLATLWTLRPEKQGTQVNLTVRFEFANPLYSAVSAAVSDKVAGTMIEAFAKHARTVLGARKVL